MVLKSHIAVTVATMALLAGKATAQSNPAPSDNWTQAEVNLAVPDTLKPSGAHGTVVIEGGISPDGHIADARVAKSSRSADLDALALSRYGKALLAADPASRGKTQVRLNVRFYNAGFDMNFENYSCAQANLDADWFGRNFPGEVEKSPLFSLLSFSGMLLGTKQLAFARDPVVFQQAWEGALDACRTRPETNFVPVLIAAGNKIKH